MTQSLADIPHRPIVVRVVSVALVIVGGSFWLMAAFLLVFAASAFEGIYAGAGMLEGLAAPTTMVFHISHALRQFGHDFGAVWIMAVAGLALWAGWSSRRRAAWLAGAFAVVSLLVLQAVLLLLIMTLLLPFHGLLWVGWHD